MPTTDDQGRPEPPEQGDELATLVGFLEFHRATLAWKCSGLDAAGLATTVGPSSLTLGGLLKHLALVEDTWFSYVLMGNDPSPPWDTVDWEAAPDWEFDTAGDEPPEDLLARWEAAVGASRRHLEAALESGGLDQTALRTRASGAAPSLRWILTHMVEEYARHNGHADLIREAVDGLVGE